MRSFPEGRAEKRRVLLDAVESVRDVVLAGADEADAISTLPPATVGALSASGLLALKLPAELGGAEADPVTQLEVIEALTYLDTSAGWCMFIGATSIGWPGAFLPDEAVAQIFAGGRIPTAAGIGGITGTAVEVEGGYLLSGRFQFASGIRHAEWLIGGARIARGDGERPEERMFVFPPAAAEIHDNWQVAGLRGTGSNDFTVNDLFVARAFTWDRADQAQGRPQRGGPIFRLGHPGFTAMEHIGFALGAGRRALDLISEQAQSKRRGYGPSATLLAERAVFQRFVGEADLKLRAARELSHAVFERAWSTVCAGETPDARLQAELQAAAVLTSDVGVDVATQAFRFAGGGALYSSGLLQRYWRDVNAAAQHLAVSDAAYESYGRVRLGLDGVSS